MQQEHLSSFQKFEQGYFSKGKVWMYTALSIIIFGLILMTIRDVNELNLINLFLLGYGPNPLSGLLGSPSTASYQQAITIETLINHSTEQILLLAMSLFKLAIGGFIFLIVQNLVATRKYAVAKAEAAGIPMGPAPKTPFFAKLFPILLVLGTDIQFFNVGVLMSIWDLNALNLLNFQFAGLNVGAGFQSAVLIEKLIGSFVVPVEMAGATFMLTAIPLGLATIVVNLRMQGKMLPMLLSEILGRRTSNQRIIPHASKTLNAGFEGVTRGIVPKAWVIFTMIGLILGIGGILVSPIRVQNITTIVNESFSQTVSTTLANMKLYDGIMALTVEQALFIALGIVLLAVNIFLLQIINALRAQRKFFGDTVQSVTRSQITPLEKPLWMTRGALILTSIGFGLMILNFLFALVADGARISGDALTDGTFSILVRYVKFASFGFLLTGVGLNLVNIMINLQLTARTLPNFFTKLMQFVQTGRQDSEKIDLPEPMSLAPWKLFYVILAGTILTILVLVPFGLIEVQSFLTWKSLSLAGNTSSPAYSSALLLDNLLNISLLPIKLFGMGLALFGIGRTFSVILGFVKARRQLISEGIDSLLTLTQRSVEAK
jgi:hypothetical protein